ncbi:MAG: thioredoxin family protein [Verrucomicrobiales bacterium]|nr:thioredoxin family protein [Verrucomicrobiales bacterium]
MSASSIAVVASRFFGGIWFALVLLFFTGSLDAQETLTWHTDYDDALAEARRTGKPVFLEFRCVPCVNGREFDAKVYYTPPESKRGKLMSRFVLARINTMTGVDLARFDRDWHNSLYYFIINAEEEIYLRYGGRDGSAADAYLDCNSLELALEAGLHEHAKYGKGEMAKKDASVPQDPVFPRDYGMIRTEVIGKGRCTECHLIADYSMQEKELAGLLDPITDLYRSPDIRKLGLHLDIPRGLVLAKVDGAASAAGLMAGDAIVELNGIAVRTFGDLQYQYDKVPRRTSESVEVTVIRNGKRIRSSIELPFEWWKSDLQFRHWSMEPQIFFESGPLTDSAKNEMNLPVEGFAERVTGIDVEAVLSGHHSLKVGDIITAVNHRTTDPLTKSLSTHITIRHRAGTELLLSVLREDVEKEIPLHTQSLAFRKNPVPKEETGLWVQWSASQYVTKGKEKILRYRAAVTDGHLLIEARHEPGWHSYALDNGIRSERVSGRTDGSHELPTSIKLSESVQTIGPWIQTEPNDYSKPDIRWYTYGFEGTSYFAVPLEPGELKTTGNMEISITSQVCDSTSCAGTFELKLSVPVPPNESKTLFTRRIIEQLSPVLTD